MDPIIFVLVALVALLAVVVAVPFIALERKRIRSGGSSSSSTKVSDVPAIAVEFLSRNPKDGSFIVFLTDECGKDGAASFTQISVEGGQIGVDHVFTADLNRRSSAKFEALMSESGVIVRHHSQNDVDYLRGQTENAPALAREILRSVLGYADDRSVSVIEEFVE